QAAPPRPAVARAADRWRRRGDDGNRVPRRLQRQGQRGARLDAPLPKLAAGLYRGLEPADAGQGEGVTPAPAGSACRGHPSSPVTGRWIQPKSGRNPVHQITFVTSSARPSSSTGSPSRTPAVRALTYRTPAAARWGSLTRSSGPPCPRISGRIFRPSGVFMVRTWFAANHRSRVA